MPDFADEPDQLHRSLYEPKFLCMIRTPAHYGPERTDFYCLVAEPVQVGPYRHPTQPFGLYVMEEDSRGHVAVSNFRSVDRVRSVVRIVPASPEYCYQIDVPTKTLWEEPVIYGGRRSAEVSGLRCSRLDYKLQFGEDYWSVEPIMVPVRRSSLERFAELRKQWDAPETISPQEVMQNVSKTITRHLSDTALARPVALSRTMKVARSTIRSLVWWNDAWKQHAKRSFEDGAMHDALDASLSRILPELTYYHEG